MIPNNCVYMDLLLDFVIKRIEILFFGLNMVTVSLQ